MSYGHGSNCYCDTCCAKRNASVKAYNQVHAAGKRHGETEDDFLRRILAAQRRAYTTAQYIDNSNLAGWR